MPPKIEPTVYEVANVPTSNIVQMDPNRLTWDDAYQKPPDMDWVAAISRNFNQDFFLPCLVSQRDGQYWLIDGMNRREVAIKRGIELPCIIYPGASREREAAIFAGVNHNRRVVHFYETLRAALVAGQSWAVDIQRICRSLGLELELTANAPRPGKIGAVQSVYVAYKRSNLSETLSTLIKAWGKSDQRVFQRALIDGVSRFLFRYAEMVSVQAVDEMLSRVSYGELLRQASYLQSSDFNSGTGGADSMARAVVLKLVQLYNTKRKPSDRLPERPKLKLLPAVGG